MILDVASRPAHVPVHVIDGLADVVLASRQCAERGCVAVQHSEVLLACHVEFVVLGLCMWGFTRRESESESGRALRSYGKGRGQAASCDPKEDGCTTYHE